MMNTMDSMYSTFGAPPGQLTGTIVFNDMTSWFSNTTGTPNPNIQAIQSDLAILANSVNAVAAQSQTILQFVGQLYSQYLNLAETAIQSTTTLMNAAVQNQKVS
jgi:hypothetical protein